MRKSAESVEGVVDFAEPNIGSMRSSGKTDGVDGIQVYRRSPRFLADGGTPEISDKKNLGVSGVLVMENTPEVVKERTCEKMSSGLKILVGKIDGAGGFEGCRRSPRLAAMGVTPASGKLKEMGSGMKMSGRNIDGVDGFGGCRRSPRLLAIENTPGGKLNSGLGGSSKKTDGIKGLGSGGRGSSRSSRFVSVIGRTPEIGETKTGLDMGNYQLICGGSDDRVDGKEAQSKGVKSGGSTKRGRKALEVISLIEMTRQDGSIAATPRGKQKKKRNVDSENDENLGKNADQLSKGKAPLQEVEKTSLTHLRTPLSSIENISPKETQTLGGGKNPKKLVVSQKALKGAVKSMRGLKKKTGDSPVGNQCGVRGWTKEQEVALQKAYFAAKPSPHIWKRISKMVPGKSAQDCFDKIQSKSITPLSQPRRRSRTTKTTSPSTSPLCLSSSKLLEPTPKLKVKKPRATKRAAQKTARHLLQKQNLANQGYKKDLFSILEPNASTSIPVFTQATPLFTPKCAPGTKDFLSNYNERSLSSKTPLSRCSNSTRASNVAPSPAVLKQVKDMTAHEKYIDQLHSREAKRRAAGKRQQHGGKENVKEGVVLGQDAIKAAKNALVSDASDMIKKFQSMQANALDSCDDLYDVNEDSAEEDEDC